MNTSGISLVSSFDKNQSAGYIQLFNEYFGAKYVRSDDWKLVSLANDMTRHLYNLKTDRTEITGRRQIRFSQNRY